MRKFHKLYANGKKLLATPPRRSIDDGKIMINCHRSSSLTGYGDYEPSLEASLEAVALSENLAGILIAEFTRSKITTATTENEITEVISDSLLP